MPETISPEVECLKLKKVINENYHLAKKHADDAVDRALIAGSLLIKWKELLPHGDFEGFVEKHFDGSLRTAQVYIKAAKGLSSLPKSAVTALLSTEDSLNGLISRLKKDDSAAAARGGRSPAEPSTVRPRGLPDLISESGRPGGGLSPSSTVPPASAAPGSGEAADSKGENLPLDFDPFGFDSRRGEDERTDSQGTKPQETDPRPPRSGKEQKNYGKCPNCAGVKWAHEEGGVFCTKCHHPHGEPVGDRAEDADPAGIKRAKAVKTCEALMREFDDLNLLVPKAGAHKQCIDLCKSLLKSAKGWK